MSRNPFPILIPRQSWQVGRGFEWESLNMKLRGQGERNCSNLSFFFLQTCWFLPLLLDPSFYLFFVSRNWGDGRRDTRLTNKLLLTAGMILEGIKWKSDAYSVGALISLKAFTLEVWQTNVSSPPFPWHPPVSIDLFLSFFSTYSQPHPFVLVHSS